MFKILINLNSNMSYKLRGSNNKRKKLSHSIYVTSIVCTMT